jgi:DNA processing protein
MSALLNDKYPPLSSFQEFLAYEALWDNPECTFRTIAQRLKHSPFASTLIENVDIERYKKRLLSIVEKLPDFGVRIFGDGEFPLRLNDARYPLRIFYYQGDWQLTYLPSVAVVGTRQPSDEGRRIAEALVRRLVRDKIVIVSGLAKGIDTIAHTVAIENNGSTIAVIGTPLNYCYPPENQSLQNQIARNHLLISQVPFLRYASQDYRKNRWFFPERNVTMSALTDATIIVEAGETSGTLVQARAALQQGRKLFILDNNFLNPSLSWPKKYEKEGAIRIKNYNELKQHLSTISPKD